MKKPQFIDHFSFIVKDLKKTEEFYSKIFGNPVLKNEILIVYKIGDTRLFFKEIAKGSSFGTYEKDNIGMNHIGLGVRTIEELHQFDQFLTEISMSHSEFKTGRFGNQYIWFDDPNGIRLEIYHRPIEELWLLRKLAQKIICPNYQTWKSQKVEKRFNDIKLIKNLLNKK